MIDYFEIDGSKSARRFTTLFENIITCGVFEVLIFYIVKAVKRILDIAVGSTAYVVLNYILLFQSIGVIALVLYMSFRHNCIYVCDDYIEIKDGLILYRLLYKRKIHYSDIVECRKYTAKDRKFRSAANIFNVFTDMFFEMQPYCGYEKHSAVVIYRRTFGSYVFSPEDQEGFINAVNKRLYKSAEQNQSRFFVL